MIDRKIIISNGWEPDQNNALAEVVIPSTVETLNAPTKVTFMGEVLNWIPSTADRLQEINCPNATVTTGNLCKGFTTLTTINIPKVLSFSNTESNVFYGCSALTTINAGSLVSIVYSASGSGAFANCTSLVSVTLESLEAIVGTGGGGSGVFRGCSSLKTVNFPKFKSESSTGANNSGTFYGCAALESVNLGSEGHPVTSLGTSTFAGCAQSGLTITVYTADGNAISGSPWGAANATIIWEEA